MTPEFQLVSLARALTWDVSCVALASQWKEGYVRLLRERFVTCTQLDSSGLLKNAADVMDTSELEMLLLSPRVSWRLLRDLEQDTVNSFQSEILRVLDEDSDDGGGDEKKLEPGCVRLAEMIVDYQSSYDCPSREPGEPALARVPLDSVANLFAFFEESVGLLERRAPNVHHFVRQMTTRVVIRSDVAHTGSFASGSFREHAGLSLIVNPDVLLGDAPRLIDALVHESVHASIYMYEPLVGAMCLPHPNGLRVRSGWSGRMLTLDQYVQACFVWWGLVNLWLPWLSEGESDQRVASLLERAARGFAVRPVSLLREEIDEKYLDERTWDALFHIERNGLQKHVIAKAASPQ